MEQPAPTALPLPARVARVHIIGGPGSGKTSLAADIAARTGIPVHQLDEVARVGGGNGPVRSPQERARLVDAILAGERWITEGVHLGWVEPFLERADVIVWLDYVSWRRATRRIVRRFVEGAIAEMRTRPARERFTRFRDYGRHLRTLGGAILDTRRYYDETPAASPAPVTGSAMTPGSGVGTGTTGRARAATSGGGESTLDSRSETLAELAPYRAKLVHCRSASDVERFRETFRRPAR